MVCVIVVLLDPGLVIALLLHAGFSLIRHKTEIKCLSSVGERLIPQICWAYFRVFKRRSTITWLDELLAISPIEHNERNEQNK